MRGSILNLPPSCPKFLFSALAHKVFASMENKRDPIELTLASVPYRPVLWRCFSFGHSSSCSRANKGYKPPPHHHFHQQLEMQSAVCAP